MKFQVKKLILFFLLLDNLFIPVDLGFDFRVNYIVYVIYILYAIYLNKKIYLNKNFLIGSLLLVITSLIISVIKGSPTILIFKQAVLIYVSFFVSYVLLNDYKYDILKIIKDYIDLIYLATIVGFIQLFSQFIGFKWGSDFSYLGFDMGAYKVYSNTRIQSWFYEPSFLVYAFMPVIFIVIARFFKLTSIISIKRGVLILIIFLLSRSAIGYLGLLVSIIMILNYKSSILKSPRIIVISLVLSFIASFYLYKVPDIKFRIDDTVQLFFDEKVSGKDLEKTNLSTYALYSNYKITKETFFNNPLLGTGLGTYAHNYDKYLYEVVPSNSFRKYYKVNRNDANSMLFRMLAEIGFIGTFLFIFLIFSKRCKLDYFSDSTTISKTQLWLVSNGIFVLILIRLLRQGHYTMMGFSLFLLLYYYTYKELKNLKDNEIV